MKKQQVQTLVWRNVAATPSLQSLLLLPGRRSVSSSICLCLHVVCVHWECAGCTLGSAHAVWLRITVWASDNFSFCFDQRKLRRPGCWRWIPVLSGEHGCLDHVYDLLFFVLHQELCCRKRTHLLEAWGSDWWQAGLCSVHLPPVRNKKWWEGDTA